MDKLRVFHYSLASQILYSSISDQDSAISLARRGIVLTPMEQKRLILPLERVLLTQINEQQYRFGKLKPTEKPEEKGVTTFYHPQGIHDDQL